MSFYMPAKVYSEANCVMNHSSELAALGTRALIVTGPEDAAPSLTSLPLLKSTASHGWNLRK